MGSTGTAATALDPNGYASFGNQTLPAYAASGGTIEPGEQVVVCGGGAQQTWPQRTAWTGNSSPQRGQEPIVQLIVAPA